MRIAVTADLHWGHNAAGDDATRQLVEHLRRRPPDLLLLGGDVGSGDHFAECLRLFGELTCPKALVPGNHDLWVGDDDPRGDSLQVYDDCLPRLCAAHSFHFLDRAPLLFHDQGLAVVGSINWYDYSWSLARLQNEVPDWEWRLRHMAFTRGRHNDRRFVRWRLDDGQFTRHVVAAFARHLDEALAAPARALVLTHHPAFYDLSFPRAGPPSVPDGLLWDAFAGNAALPDVLQRHAERIALVLSGHTHRAREGRLGDIRGINVGGDYHFKRLLEVRWPDVAIESFQFGTA
ncbi:MAG: metallophosphoesterase [Gemmataceae bacterium]|nr:metallophosphoesterase [Gemmataceae bacterium]